MTLEGAYRMRKAHQESAKKEAEKDPITGESISSENRDRTLSEIFADKDEHDLFLSFLYGQDPDEAKNIVESIAAGTVLTDKQNTLLEKSRDGFNIRRIETESMKQLFTAEEVVRIAETDPKIKEIVGKIGGENAAELLQSQLNELLLTDNKAYKKLIANFRAVRNIRTSEDTKKLDEKVKETLDRLKITEEEYFKATEGGFVPGGAYTADMKDKLEKLAYEKMTGFERALDFIPFFNISLNRGKELAGMAVEQNKLLVECDKHLKGIGTVLRGTLNTDTRLMIQKYMTEGGKLEKRRDENITTISEYKSAKDFCDDSAIIERYETYLASEAKRIKGKAGTPSMLSGPEIDAVKDRFATQESATQRKFKGRGFLSLLLAIFTRTKADIESILP